MNWLRWLFFVGKGLCTSVVVPFKIDENVLYLIPMKIICYRTRELMMMMEIADWNRYYHLAIQSAFFMPGIKTALRLQSTKMYVHWRSEINKYKIKDYRIMYFLGNFCSERKNWFSVNLVIQLFVFWICSLSTVFLQYATQRRHKKIINYDHDLQSFDNVIVILEYPFYKKKSCLYL